MHNRQQHDCAFAIAWRVLETIKPLIREEEQRDAVEEFYLIAQQEVERYEQAKARQEARLRPMGG